LNIIAENENKKKKKTFPYCMVQAFFSVVCYLLLLQDISNCSITDIKKNKKTLEKKVLPLSNIIVRSHCCWQSFVKRILNNI
jgi:hypothetical protein